MTSEPSDAPRHVIALRKRLENIASGDQARATIMARTVATVAVGQVLPPSAVKGGTAMTLRLGLDGSRFSTDLDVARRAGLDEFVAEFRDAPRTGWGGFTGEIRPSRTVSRPPGIPSEYVMTAREIKIAYKGRDLMTITLEIGHDELDDTVDPPTALADDIADLFAALGLPEPRPIAVVTHDHQIAQKLHAVSQRGSQRAHDLVDLQLLERTCVLTDDQVARTCVRLSPSEGVTPGHHRSTPGPSGSPCTQLPLTDSRSFPTWTPRSRGRTTTSPDSSAVAPPRIPTAST